MEKLMQIFNLKHSDDLSAVMYNPGQENHLDVVVEKLPKDSREAQKLIKERLNSPTLSHDIQYIWQLKEECLVYYAHRVGQVLIMKNSDYEKMLSISCGRL